jgi:hypothetical protein
VVTVAAAAAAATVAAAAAAATVQSQQGTSRRSDSRGRERGMLILMECQHVQPRDQGS